MGYHEGDPSAGEIEVHLMEFLEAKGTITCHEDLAYWINMSNHVVEFIQLREKGLYTLLGALLEGDFHLKGRALFIPEDSVDKAKDIVITKDHDLRGYWIKRKKD